MAGLWTIDEDWLDDPEPWEKDSSDVDDADVEDIGEWDEDDDLDEIPIGFHIVE